MGPRYTTRTIARNEVPVSDDKEPCHSENISDEKVLPLSLHMPIVTLALVV